MQDINRPSHSQNFIDSLSKRILTHHPSIKDISQQRKARITTILSIGLAFTSMIGMFFIGLQNIGQSFIMLGILACFSLVSYFLSRSQSYYWGSVVLLATLSIVGFALVLAGSENPILSLATTIPLGLVIGSALISVPGLITLLSLNVAGILLLPVFLPAFSFVEAGMTLAIFIPLGALLIFITVFQNNLEKARLSEVQLINQELISLSASLEDRVNNATRNLELAAQIGRKVSMVSDIDTLLNQSVEIIQEGFNLYYTQIYLIDPSGKMLILQAGSGSVGRTLCSRGHRLPINMSSLNGIAAIEQRAVIVEDTESNYLHRPNPLLPDTRSEMAIPLLVGERVVGVLDMQGDKPGVLNKDKLTAFEALAGQLAISITNTELFAETEQAQAELKKQTQRLTNEGWHEFMNAIDRKERLAYTYDKGNIVPSEPALHETQEEDTMIAPIRVSDVQVGKLHFQRDQAWTEDDYSTCRSVAQQVATQIESLRLLAQAERYQVEAQNIIKSNTREGWQRYQEQFDSGNGFVYQDNQVFPSVESGNSFKEARTFEINVRNEPIGAIDIDINMDLSEENIEFVSFIQERLGSHLENLRLSMQTQAALLETKDQAQRVQALYDIGRKLNSASNDEEILLAVMQPVQEAGCDSATLYYIEENEDEAPCLMTQVANWRRDGRNLFPNGHQYDLTKFPSSNLLLASPDRPQLIEDIANDERVDDILAGIWEQLGLNATVIVPIFQVGKWLGLLTFGWSETYHYSNQEVGIYEAISSLVTPVVQSHRLFVKIQDALNEAETFRQLAEASGQGIGIGSIDGISSYVNPRLLEMLGFSHASDLIGKPFAPLYPPEHWHKFENKIMPQLMLTGNWVGELALIRSDGSIFPTLDNFFLLKDDTGNPQYIVDIVTDITDRRNQELATIKHAAELETVAEVGAIISTLLSEEDLLDTVVILTRERFNLYHCHILLTDPDRQVLQVKACGWEKDSVHEGTVEQVSIALDQPQSLVAQAARDQQVIIVNDVMAAPNWLPNELLPETRSEMAIPIIAGEQVLGVLDIQSDEVDRFHKEDISIMTTLSSQVAVALQNARTHTQTQKQAENEAMINLISQRIQNTTSVESAMQVAIRELGRALGAKRTNIQLGLSDQPRIHLPGNGSSPKD
ncbi:GAF domain-containing protein [Chloroflexota bacterium]